MIWTSLLLITELLTLSFVAASSYRHHSGRFFGVNKLKLATRENSHLDMGALSTLRGGDDEERYSRQVYALGQRAHGLIRSATVYLDGPLSSGLLYECAKNLVLSGVGNLVILKPQQESELDEQYHFQDFDDLGISYKRAARKESGAGEELGLDCILQMFLQRLNPSVRVSIDERNHAFKAASDGVLVSVDRPHSTQVSLNRWCRSLGIKFVAIETAGVFGKTFCDFGPTFTVYDSDGESPSSIPVNRLRVLEGGDTLQLDCMEGERHDVSKGDVIEFVQGTGDTIAGSTCEVLEVKSPTQLLIQYKGDSPLTAFCDNLNTDGATFRRLKIPEAVEFSPLEAVISNAYGDDSLFAICDLDKSFDSVRKAAILSSFQALALYIEKNGNHPTIEALGSFSSVAKMVHEVQSCDPSWDSIVRKFAKTCKGKLSPVQAIVGAIGAQEALKAASGLYNPVKQFLLFDCDEVLDDEINKCEHNGMASTGQAYVLGDEVCEALSKKKIFVVGAGAIGCELLKNLATMGACRLIITDMDTIEKSNLSRQLLFRDSDIGAFKSVAAQQGISRFNPQVDADVHTSRVGEGENGPFDHDFWSEKLDIVLNALDNLDARLHVDRQCVAYQKALIDAGTLGSKGNVQVVLPFQSESYGSSVDPPEPAIPVCTVKNFPYLISHTIQWGRELFDGFFTRRPQQINEFKVLLMEKGTKHVVRHLLSESGEEAAKESMLEFLEDLRFSQHLNVSVIQGSAIEWAVRQAIQLFCNDIELLLVEHPRDSIDEDGEPFWSGSRRAPRPLRFVSGEVRDPQQLKINENLVSFVRNCARLRIEAVVPSYKESGDSRVSREAVESYLSRNISSQSEVTSITALVEQSARFVERAPPEWLQSDFEKDDDGNGHVDFVTAASNLRAMCYGIAPVDAMETRRVAGQIVPAMITTTALVSALACVELIKLVQSAPLRQHRNAFINLGRPFFAFTQPVPAETIYGVGGRTFTLWDRTLVKESTKSSSRGGMKMNKLLSRILRKAGLDEDLFEISTVSFGRFMLYASFVHQEDDEQLKKPIWELIEEAIKSEEEYAGRDGLDVSSEAQLLSLEQKPFVDLSVIVEEKESGLEMEIPPVRLEKSR